MSVLCAQAANGLSCRLLQCATTDAALCATCQHGQAVLVNQQVACNCTGTQFTGATCNIAVCQHGGTLDPTNSSQCECLPPYAGQFCSFAVCYNGGTFFNQTCTCPLEWTGTQCQIPSGLTVPGGGTESSSSSSSSSTAGSSSTTTSSSSTSLSTGAIAGIAVAAVVGGVLIIGAAVYFGLARVLGVGASKAVAKSPQEVVKLIP